MGRPDKQQRSKAEKKKRAKPRSRQLYVKEVRFIVSQLKEADLNVLEAFVIRHINNNEVHVSAYKDRQNLWEFLSKDKRLTGLLELLRNNFCRLVDENMKGGEKFARFLVAWYQFCSLSNSSVADKWKETLSRGYPICVKDADAYALLSSIGSAVHVCLQKQISLLHDSWRTIQLNAVSSEAEPDDDASLYRLFGFSLFASIQHRKRAVFGRLRKRRTFSTRATLLKELRILENMLETDKSVLPAVIAYQDRGRMSFPHRNLLPFCRKCSKAIKNWINPHKYRLQRRNVIRVARKEVLSDSALLQDFTTVTMYLVGSRAHETLVKTLYSEVVQRVVNTMAHSFFQGQDMLERIATNKGVEAHASLRDKLKVYACDTSTRLQL